MNLQHLATYRDERLILATHIRAAAAADGPLRILEAGCGTRWGVDLGGVAYTLTGVDLDKDAMEIRRVEKRDLDVAVVGDLRTVELEAGAYDVVFSSNVLEHIDGAERVLDNMVRWTRPGGMLVLLMPNGRSAKGFLTKVLPHWIHVLYVRHVQGQKTAGQPGYGPYRTYFDPVVSQQGIAAYCDRHGLTIEAGYSAGHGRRGNRILMLGALAVTWAVHALTLGGLTARHPDLIFVIRKP
jgi:SAM-dependent methyltransferase